MKFNKVAIFGACLFGMGCMFGGLVPSNKELLIPHFPDWWFERDVILQTGVGQLYPDDYTAASDYSPINQGQLKALSRAAYDELESLLPADALITVKGQALTDLISSWYVGGDLNAAVVVTGSANTSLINLGQLKYIASLFYDVLAESGYTNAEGFPPLQWQDPVWRDPYPWTDVTTDDNNYAVANLGQAKYLFSWDFNLYQLLSVDVDEDGVPDFFEQQIVDLDTGDVFESVSDVSADSDFDEDKLSNFIESVLRSDLTNATDQGAGEIINSQGYSSSADVIIVVGNQIMEVEEQSTVSILREN